MKAWAIKERNEVTQNYDKHLIYLRCVNLAGIWSGSNHTLTTTNGISNTTQNLNHHLRIDPLFPITDPYWLLGHIKFN